MSTSLTSVIIAGGGMAGFSAAQELRSRGFSGSITLIDPEGLPYDRPPLSKGYLLGSRDAASILLTAPDWFTDNNVGVLTDSVVEVHPDQAQVVLASGESLVADKIILATGGIARRLPIAGGQLPGVLQLRTRADADYLRSRLGEGTRLVIVGAGLIGAEVASSALTFGASVTLIDPVDPPLIPAVGEALARRLHLMHHEKEISVLSGTPSEITAQEDGPYRIVMQQGDDVEADVVLAGIGIVADTSLAAAAGLEVDNGILVDESQQTSHPNVFAIGDTARTRLPDGTLLRRAEHWENAMHTGATVAAALLGEPLPQHGASWFWSDRHGVHVEGIGSLTGAGTAVTREVDGVPVASFLLDEHGHMVGCAAIDGGLLVRAARRIIAKKKILDPKVLADPNVDLKKLAR